MVLGCIWVPRNDVARLSLELVDIKRRRRAAGELKWTKVSRARLEFYKEVVEWFFSQQPLRFRALTVSNKRALNHAVFNSGSHDDFYYKMQYSLLNKILSPTEKYEVYFDIKDTRSKFKLKNLKTILLNDKYDFTGDMIERVQHVRSHEIELLQLADFLIGAVAYKHRGLTGNEAKSAIVSLIEKKISRSISASTPLSYEKFNLFVFTPRNVG